MGFLTAISTKDVHTSLCYVEGYDPIVVASTYVGTSVRSDSITYYTSDCMVLGGAATVAEYPHNGIATPAPIGVFPKKVFSVLAGASGFYDTVSLDKDYQTNIGRYVHGFVPTKTFMYSPTVCNLKSHSSIVGINGRKLGGAITVVGVKATNARLMNLFSNGSFAMQVLTALKPTVTSVINYVLKATPLCGKYNEILNLPSELADIASTSELWGLEVATDKRSIAGLVTFTEQKKIAIKLGDGARLELYVEPRMIDRIL